MQRSKEQGIVVNFVDTTMQRASLLCSTFLEERSVILKRNILAFKVKVYVRGKNK